MLKCKECGVEREEQYFSKSKSKYKGVIKYYFWLKKCKLCQGMKSLKGTYNKTDNSTRIERKIESGIELSKEAKDFLNELKMSNGYIDMLGAYKLAHYFIETFEYIDLDDMEIKDQLMLMHQKLLQLENGNTPIKTRDDK
jgi:hypothetical protein